MRGYPWAEKTIVPRLIAQPVRQPSGFPVRRGRWRARAVSVPSKEKVVPFVASPNPEENCAAAQIKVERLEAALAASGREPFPERDTTEGFLARVKLQEKFLLDEKMLSSFEIYLESSKQKLKEAEEAVVASREKWQEPKRDWRD